eukprot:1156601-Pelagomonas_calceolata.AAC.5
MLLIMLCFSYLLLQMYSPLLAWAHETLGWSLVASDSIAGPSQSNEAISAVRRFLEGKWGSRCLQSPARAAGFLHLLMVCQVHLVGHLKGLWPKKKAQAYAAHQPAWVRGHANLLCIVPILTYVPKDASLRG